MLVTGSSGLVGSLAAPYFSCSYGVTPARRSDFDIRRLDSVFKFVKKSKPDIILHAAAATSVDRCETDRQYAYDANVLGSKNIAMAAEASGAALVFLSTDYVFKGDKREGYSEADIESPVNYYGLTKLSGEREVRTFCRRFYIMRTAWLFAPGGGFIERALSYAGKTGPVLSARGQTGSPTYVPDLLECAAALVKTGAFGLYHAVNSGMTARSGVIERFLELRGIRRTVKEADGRALGQVARRPVCSALISLALAGAGIKPLRSWEDALADYAAL